MSDRDVPGGSDAERPTTERPGGERSPFDGRAQRALRNIARASITCGLDSGKPRIPDVDGLPLPLQAPGACFVTLRRQDGTLRGCVGRLEAYRPLAVDVAHNAYAAAFRDPRFQGLTPPEWIDCSLSIAVLGTPVPIDARDEAALIAGLEPEVHGLILEDGGRRGTFLPAVWDQMPDRRDFVQQLKRKIGWSVDHWTPTMQAWRYHVHSF